MTRLHFQPYDPAADLRGRAERALSAITAAALADKAAEPDDDLSGLRVKITVADRPRYQSHYVKRTKGR